MSCTVVTARNLVTLEGRVFAKAESASVSELVCAHRRAGWERLKLRTAIDGRQVAPDSDEIVPDESVLTVCPEIGFLTFFVSAFVLTAFFVTAAATIGVFIYGASRALRRATGRRDPSQARGDERSPAYGWNGMQTSYRTGLPKPIVCGNHDVPGQVIASDVVSYPAEPRTDILRILLALNDGPSFAIGNVLGGESGEADNLGSLGGISTTPLPDNLRVNGNILTSPGAEASIRLGRQYQSPVPGFDGAPSALDVNGELNDRNQNVAKEIANADASSFEVRLVFPQGLYEIEQNGSYIAATVDFRVSWRVQGQQWSVPQPVRVSRLERERFTVVHRQDLSGRTGPFEVRVLRLTAHRDPDLGFVSDACSWQTLTHRTAGQFRYPNTTLLGLSLLASEQLRDAAPTIQANIDGSPVWTWDPATGITANQYESTPIWQFPVGQNPGWVAAMLLMSRKALGELYGADRIDWPAWRAFADYCDQQVLVNGQAEALHRFDGVFDAGEDGLAALARVCRCGRGVPIMIGDKMSVRYSYRDQHGRGGEIVPAKQRRFILNTANIDVQSLKVVKHDTRQRPSRYDVQYLDRDAKFAQEVLPVRDPRANHDALLLRPAPVVIETLPLYGVTRASHAEREGLFYHAINALSDITLDCKAGVEALPLEIGDVFGFEHYSVRPFDEEQQRGLRCTVAGDNITQIRLDDEIEVDIANGGTWIAITQKDYTTTEVQILSASSRTYVAGEAIVLAQAVTTFAGAPVVVGRQEKTLIDMEVTYTRLRENMVKEIEAIRWVPEAHDLPSQDDFSPGRESAGNNLAPAIDIPKARSVGVQQVGLGRVRVVWDPPEGYGGRPVRIYFAPDGEEWQMIGERTTSSVELEGIESLKRYRVAVAAQDRGGAFSLPEASGQVEFLGEEFAPVDVYPVSAVIAKSRQRDVVLTWPRIDDRELAHYEIRRGKKWLGAEVLGTTSDPEFVHASAPLGESTYLVRARARNGLYGALPAAVTITHALPDAWSLGSVDELSAGAPGTAGGTEWDAGEGALVLSSGKLQGTYTSAELGPAAASDGAEVYWTLRADGWWLEQAALLDDADYLVDGGEARWRTLDGREPTFAQPGVDFDRLLDDAGLLDDDPHPIDGPIGELGEHVRIEREIRFRDPVAGWGDWEPYRPQRRCADAAQARLTLHRRSADYQVRAARLSLAGTA